MKTKHLCSVFGIFCLFFILPVLSLSKDKTNINKITLEDIVNMEISVASYVVSNIKDQPVSVTVISRKQLELSGARTLSEAIMTYVPGCFVVEDHDDVIVGFRGLAPDNNSKVMLLIDGQNMNTEWFWGPPDAIIHTVNYEWIDHVEVIRGPGSVTLGQGALLGVINIITRDSTNMDKEELKQSSFILNTGKDGAFLSGVDGIYRKGEIKAYFHAATSKYDGQDIRPEGWAVDKSFEGSFGTNIANSGVKLKKSDNTTFIGKIAYKGLEFNLMYFDQLRDLYNFYRDRNRVQQIVNSLGVSYTTTIGENKIWKTSLNYICDDYFLYSTFGATAGGTRENRYSIKSILNISNAWETHNFAMGLEMKRYEYGRKNKYGNNFIVNKLDETIFTELPSLNEQYTWVYEQDTDVKSLFVEDFISTTDKLTLFGALRFDSHTFWGNNLSPRLGAIFKASEDLTYRFSYQTGFRGAVGIHYSGGYRQDGYLREENFSQIEAAQIPILDNEENIIGYESNIPNTKPEEMESYEIAVNYNLNKKWNIETVGFYNIIKNVLDVGVIWRPDDITIPDIGSDIAGDWNGYWYYKNTEGKINQFGLETSLTYAGDYLRATLSHAFVGIASASPQQRGSMYITSDDKIKAYPKNVTRLNILATPTDKFTINTTLLYYSGWNAPNDQVVDGNMILNTGLAYHFNKNIELSFMVKNLLNADELYPMNSNVGGEDLSNGSPSLEERTYWLKVKYSF